MTTKTRFVHVPSAVLLRAIIDWGAKVAEKGGRFGELAAGHEVAFMLSPPGSGIEVQVYTSVARGEAEARACGQDAVRIVVGARTKAGEWRNVRAPQKLLRTAPKGEEAQRVAAFLARLHGAVRGAYGHALQVPHCPDCGAMMAQRLGSRGNFWGCIEYPQCRGTREVTSTAGGSGSGIGTGVCRGPSETAESTASRGRARITDQHEPVTSQMGNRANRRPAESQDRPRSASSSLRSASAAMGLRERMEDVAVKHHGWDAREVLRDGEHPMNIDPEIFK